MESSTQDSSPNVSKMELLFVCFLVREGQSIKIIIPRILE